MELWVPGNNVSKYFIVPILDNQGGVLGKFSAGRWKTPTIIMMQKEGHGHNICKETRARYFYSGYPTFL
jgi:hypothetical protein